jgi:hypothetical protein
MGGASSTVISNTVSKNLNEMLTNIAVNKQNLTKNISSVVQQADLSLDGADITCTSGSGILNASVNGSVKFMTTVDDQTFQNIKNDLLNSITTEKVQEASSSAGLGGAADSSVSSYTATDIQNVIKNEMTINTLNESINSVNFDQNLKLVLKNIKYTGACPIVDLNAILDLQFQNQIKSLSNSITDVIKKDETITKETQTATSVSSLLPDFGTLLIIGVGIIFLIMFIGGSAIPKPILVILILLFMAGIGYLIYWFFFSDDEDKDEGFVMKTNLKTNQLWNMPNYYI